MTSTTRRLLRGKTLNQAFLDLVFGFLLVFVLLATAQHHRAEAEAERAKRAEELLNEADLRVGELKDGNAEQGETIKKLQSGLSATQQDAVDQRERADYAEGQLAALQRDLGQPLRFRFVVDATGSMTREIAELKKAVRTICEVLTEIGKPVELLIVGYREDVIAELPLTRVSRPTSDNGASFAAVDQVLGQLEAENGYANLPKAIDAALADNGSFEGLDLLVLLADQDTREAAIDLGQGGAARVEREAIDTIVKWATTPDQTRRVISFFAESGKTPEARRFFETVAAEVPDGRFSDETIDLLQVVLSEVLPRASQ